MEFKVVCVFRDAKFNKWKVQASIAWHIKKFNWKFVEQQIINNGWQLKESCLNVEEETQENDSKIKQISFTKIINWTSSNE